MKAGEPAVVEARRGASFSPRALIGRGPRRLLPPATAPCRALFARDRETGSVSEHRLFSLPGHLAGTGSVCIADHPDIIQGLRDIYIYIYIHRALHMTSVI